MQEVMGYAMGYEGMFIPYPPSLSSLLLMQLGQLSD
jgi:hypothetical protein